MNDNKSKFVWALSLFAIGLGIFLRFWHITSNQFLFYDEGMYLGYNRNFIELVAANPPRDIHELFIILGLMIKAALGTAKALWFFLLNLRVFIFGPKAWYFARLISAFSSLGTIALTYFFAYRYYRSKNIAFLSIILLSLLPSHVFYSRLGMQESLSALLFLSALYIYLFYQNRKWSSVVSSLLLVCLFLTNYRMIVGPIFIVAIEFFESLRNRHAINWQRLIIHVGTFAAVVFIIGSLYGGVNRYVTFGWMFHQAQEAQSQRSFINIFSFPYEIFILEGFLFGILFWSNCFLVIKKQWSKILPFILVLIQMAGFSLAAEKGARYLCVVLPLMAIAAAVMIDHILHFEKIRKYLIGFVILTCLSMAIQSFKIMQSQNDYARAVKLITEHDPKSGILSTQPLVEQLYVDNENSVKECPKNLGDFIDMYKQGYRYLILDPQVYISWTKDQQRFSPPLIDFLQSIYDDVPPLATMLHLNKVLLTRFVLDHNQNLIQSIKFLNNSSSHRYGEIRIYDIGQSLLFLRQQALNSNGR